MNNFDINKGGHCFILDDPNFIAKESDFLNFTDYKCSICKLFAQDVIVKYRYFVNGIEVDFISCDETIVKNILE